MMNSKEIFEEYTKATAKRKYISDKAAELNVKESDIICELFKSGYKFEEIKRANKGIYNAGLNKFKKWQENGSPEDEDADALESHCPENDTTEQADEEKPEYDYPATDESETDESSDKDLMKIISELKYRNEVLETKIKSLVSENIEMKAENGKLTKDVEILEGRNESLHSERKQFMDRIDELTLDLQQASHNCTEAMALNEKIRREAEIDAADLESEQEHLKKVYQENEGLKKRLERAERYILNSIYEQFEDRDDEDGEV